jgi:antitoxin (DNA-binding transcriptional repressor) of toxin-antitoxin stability system
VAVLPSHIHISTGRNSALTNHHASVVRLSPLDLQALLQECHSEKGWAQLLQVLVQIPPKDEQDRGRATDDDALAVERSILAFVTPTRKRKECCGEATIPSCKLGEPREKGPPPMTSSFSSDELVIIPSQDSQEASDDEHLAAMMGQWNLVVSALNHSTSVIKRLQTAISSNLDALDARLVGVKTDLGNVPSNSVFGHCISAWHGLLLLQSEFESIAVENTVIQEALQGWEQA